MHICITHMGHTSHSYVQVPSVLVIMINFFNCHFLPLLFSNINFYDCYHSKIKTFPIFKSILAMLLLQIMFEYGYQISAVPPLIQHLRDVITAEWVTMTVTTVKTLQYPVLEVW